MALFDPTGSIIGADKSNLLSLAQLLASSGRPIQGEVTYDASAYRPGGFYPDYGALLTSFFKNLFGSMTGGFGGGLGKGSGDFLNLFDLARERAHRGLLDEFTQAGGASSLEGPFTTASANLERGLGQTEQGSIVDLLSRLQGPQFGLMSSILGDIFK
jgi:hypothetical protein